MLPPQLRRSPPPPLMSRTIFCSLFPLKLHLFLHPLHQGAIAETAEAARRRPAAKTKRIHGTGEHPGAGGRSG
jgi:hypothetical protein